MALKGNNNTGDVVVVMDWAVLTYIWVYDVGPLLLLPNAQENNPKSKSTQDHDHHNHSLYHICYDMATQIKNYLTTSLRD